MVQGDLIIVEDDGERTVIWHPLLNAVVVKRISDILRDEAVFIGTFSEDPYDPSLYIQQEGLYDTKTLLLFDTNVLARVIELTKGREATREHRVPAAIMAFASSGRLLTLPAGALYEEALKRQGRDSNLDLAYFHAGDDLHPREWADIALGAARTLKTTIKPTVDTNYEFAKPLQSFGFVYPHVLKLATIELQGGTREQRFLKFVEWQFSSWIISASANLFALRLFSATPPRGALKKLRSPERQEALKGIRNAANDLAFANAYMRLYRGQSEMNELAIFCSMDVLLKDIVEDLQKAFAGVDVVSERVASEFGPSISSRFKQLNVPLRDSSERRYTQDDTYQALLEAELEGEILKYRA